MHVCSPYLFIENIGTGIPFGSPPLESMSQASCLKHGVPTNSNGPCMNAIRLSSGHKSSNTYAVTSPTYGRQRPCKERKQVRPLLSPATSPP